MKGIIICLLCAVLAGCQSSPKSQIAPPQALDKMAGQPATPVPPPKIAPIAPTRPLPELFAYSPMFFPNMNFRTGMNIKEVHDAVYRGLPESEQSAIALFDCDHPFKNDKNLGDVVFCKVIINTQVEDGSSFMSLLSFHFLRSRTVSPTAEEGELVETEESIPARFADQARSRLENIYGDPKDFSPTTWKDSNGCWAYSPKGVINYTSGGCWEVVIMPGTDFYVTEPLERAMPEEEDSVLQSTSLTLSFNDEMRKEDIEHAKNNWQPTGEIRTKGDGGNWVTLMCDGHGNCHPKGSDNQVRIQPASSATGGSAQN